MLFFAHAINSISYQAVLTLKKCFWLVYQLPHEWPNIHESEYHSEILITVQKNEKMPITVIVPTTMFSATSSVNYPIQLDKQKIWFCLHGMILSVNFWSMCWHAKQLAHVHNKKDKTQYQTFLSSSGTLLWIWTSPSRQKWICQHHAHYWYI